MKLIDVRVKFFKNILDSSDVPIEPNITCFVGKNESGKTAFLHALYRLNPAHPVAVFNVQQQYPAWLEKRHRREGIKLEEVVPVSATFAIEPPDRAKFEARFGKGSLAATEITYERDYSGKASLSNVSDEAKVVASLLAGVAIPADFADRAANISKFSELDELRTAIHANGGEACVIACASLDAVKAKMLGNASDLSSAMFSEISDLLPKFFYFDEYSSLPGTIV